MCVWMCPPPPTPTPLHPPTMQIDGAQATRDERRFVGRAHGEFSETIQHRPGQHWLVLPEEIHGAYMTSDCKHQAASNGHMDIGTK